MFLTIGAAAGDYYLVFTSTFGGSIADATVYGLTQSYGIGALSGAAVTTYASVVSSTCTGVAASTAYCVAMIAANGGGKAAIAFYVFSILFAIASAVAMSISAHHLKTGKGSPGVIGSAAVSLTLESLAFACMVIGCGCAWGTIGGLVNQITSVSSLYVWVAGPGSGLAGFALFLRLLSLILEISARNCCKPGAPAPSGGNTTIIIGGNPLAMASPMAAPQVLTGAPMGLPMAQPAAANGWLRQTDGKDNCAFARAARHAAPRPPPHTHTHTRAQL